MKIFKKILIFGIVGALLLIGVCLVSCSGEKVTLTLYDGESIYGEVEVTVGQTYNLGTPKKMGYTFLGWYSDIEGGSAYTDEVGDSAGMTWQESNSTAVYAHWEANKYTLTLDFCGGALASAPTEIDVVYDSEIDGPLPVLKKEGASFTGWFTEKSGGRQIADSNGNIVASAEIYNESVYPISKDGKGTTLYAQYGDKMVTYMFSSEGSEVETVSYAVGAVLYELPISTKENCCFEAWYFDPTYLSPLTFPYTIPETSEGFVTLHAKFEDGTVDVLQFSTIASTGDKEYEVSYQGNAERIVIPDYYYGKKVTGIKSISSTTVREILLPQTVSTLSSSAFDGCTSLESINIPIAVKVIPAKAFAGCSSLVNINIPVNVTTIGKEAFSGCSSADSISIPASVTSVGNGAFRNMSSLKSISVDEGNEKYSAKDGVLYYKMGTSMYLVQYPAGKEGDTYSIDPTAVKIMEYAFSGSQIKSITVGGKISAIDDGAFENCKNLVSVSVTSEAVTFAIDADAFLGCSNLKAIKLEMTRVPTLNATAFEGVSSTFSIYVTSSMVKTYQAANVWKDHAGKIYSVGTIFGDFATAEVDGGYTIRQYFGTADKVEIPEILNAQKIVGISENAFSHSPMSEIVISENIRSIGNNAFEGCTNLKKITMECDVPTLGRNVFAGIDENFGIYIRNTLAVLDAYKVADGWRDISDKISSSND